MDWGAGPRPGGSIYPTRGRGREGGPKTPRTLLSPIAAEVRDSGRAATVLAPFFPPLVFFNKSVREGLMHGPGACTRCEGSGEDCI